MAASNVLLLY
jgi:exonuclease III